MKTSRRSFLQSSLAAGVFPFLPGCITFGTDKVRLACVGIGQQAWNDIREFEKTGLVTIAALCDTDLNGRQCEAALKRYPDVPRFTDFRRMLDAMDGRIDAVAVMTPDFSHFPALMAAMKRHLAVFSEKPLAHTFEECELLMAAEKKYGVVTQMGNQGHSGRNYYQFKHYVDNGIIDVSKLTHMTAHMNLKRRWHKWNGNVTGFPAAEKLPEGMTEADWDVWLGTASHHGYSKDYVQGEWRSWYDFGNGCLGDWGAHTMDTMHRFFDLGLPTEVAIRDVVGWNAYVFPMQDTLTFKFASSGRRPAVELDWYEGTQNLPPLPKGYKIISASGVPPSGAGTGVQAKDLHPGKFFELSDGTVWEGASHTSPIVRCGADNSVPDYPFRNGGETSHYGNFLKAVMGEDEAHSPFMVTAPLSEVFMLGCIAQRLNRGFKFDPVGKRVIGDEVANALLRGSSGTPRKGWEEFYVV